jgi:hypothetical protein
VLPSVSVSTKRDDPNVHDGPISVEPSGLNIETYQLEKLDPDSFRLTRSPLVALKVSRMLSPELDVVDVTAAPPAVIVPVTSAAAATRGPTDNPTTIAANAAP